MMLCRVLEREVLWRLLLAACLGRVECRFGILNQF